MKFQLTMKNPDALNYALEDVPEDKANLAAEIMGKYLEYGEYLTVEFDTEAGTATVLPN